MAEFSFTDRRVALDLYQADAEQDLVGPPNLTVAYTVELDVREYGVKDIMGRIDTISELVVYSDKLGGRREPEQVIEIDVGRLRQEHTDTADAICVVGISLWLNADTTVDYKNSYIEVSWG